MTDTRPCFVAADGRFRRDRARARPLGPRRPARRRAGGAADAGVRAAAGGRRTCRSRRVTYEFLRPVPLGELSRRGRGRPRRDGACSCSRARSRRRRHRGRARAGAAGARGRRARVPRTPRPAAAARPRARPRERLPSAAPPDVRRRTRSRSGSSPGAFYGGGPATAWFRLRAPLVAGEEPSPLQRLAAAGDFGNGISAALPWDEYLFINPDLTLYIERAPVGEWICLEAQTLIAPDGIGDGGERAVRRAGPRRAGDAGAAGRARHARRRAW